ncbi:hypothetical protein [Marinilabilia rubra]|uniref:hypothetical protein n=1 Tax=Marinilabilia rubra TaxID=2162893 RepID=UPI0011B26AA2|nr:hypothetical protein [Marinilabilia rubra]
MKWKISRKLLVKKEIEKGSFAYSALAAGRENTPSEGLIYLFYESDGQGKVSVFNLPWLIDGKNWKEFLEK